MTLSFFASAFTGLLHIAVPSYGLRLSRRFGSREVGWALVAAFLGLAFLNLICGLGSGSGMSEHGSGRSLVYVVVPVLLLVGLAHVETLFRERARLESERSGRHSELGRFLELRTEELAETRAELKRLDLEQQALVEKAAQERVELAAHIATRAGQYLNRLSMRMELYLKLLQTKTFASGTAQYQQRLLAQAAEARELAHQLLACGGCAPVRPQLLSLSGLLHRHLPAMRQLLGTQQGLECACPAEPLLVWADPHQVRWILEELIRNAHEAMPDTGRVSISIERVNVNAPRRGHGQQANQFYVISVSDPGCGIERETQRHLGEPFVTTEPGQSTGLGLASASGLMKAHGGWLAVSSAPGQGTKVRLYFPPAATWSPILSHARG